jgi:hypothetical protein
MSSIPASEARSSTSARPDTYGCAGCEIAWNVVSCSACSARTLVRDDSPAWACLTCGSEEQRRPVETVSLPARVTSLVPLSLQSAVRRAKRVATVGFFVWAGVILVLGASPQVVILKSLGGTSLGPDETLNLVTVFLATFPLTVSMGALTLLVLAGVDLNYAWVIAISAAGFGLANLLGLSAGNVELGDTAGQWPVRLLIHYFATYGPALFASSVAVGVFAGWSILKVGQPRAA